MARDVLEGRWMSCIKRDTHTNEPFVADTIIENPQSVAHVIVRRL